MLIRLDTLSNEFFFSDVIGLFNGNIEEKFFNNQGQLIPYVEIDLQIQGYFFNWSLN